MLNLEQIKRELKKYNFAYEENVLPVHANGHYFLYGFYEKGIAIFALRPDWTIDEGALLPWGDVLSLKVKKSLLFENTIDILTKKMNISMKIMKSTGGCSWIKENLKKLENLNYYQNLSFAFGGAEKADDNCAASRAGQKKAQERENTTEIVEKIYRKMTEYTATPMVSFELEEGDAGLFDCKIGGAYYVPEGEHRLENSRTGEELYLLAQVNFAQIPHLPDYPEQGVMQILISSEDMYGCNFDDGYDQTGWCIRYYETLPERAEKACIHEPDWHEDTALPMERAVTYRLKPTKIVQTMPFDDVNFWPAADTCLDRELRGYLENDDVMDGLCDMYEEYMCQVGGYPIFTQSDPRSVDDGEILLFQLNSVKDIMWGDAGVANFFIDREALKNRDFSHVMYNWDCY